MKYKKTLLPIGITSAVLSGTALSLVLSTEAMLKIALDRKEPLFSKAFASLISGSKKDMEFLEACNEASEKLYLKEHKKIKLISSDGVFLSGHLFERENPSRIIIAFHGWRSSWCSDFGLIADFWENNNSAVIYVEQRGQNESGGEYMGFGLTERIDSIEWVKWANKNISSDLPIYLAGISMGASTVLMASNLLFPSNVSGIIADCGYTSANDIWKHIVIKNFHLPYGLRGKLADRICKRKIMIGSNEVTTIKALQETKIPILFIHGTDDRFVPPRMTFENYKACASPKRLFIVPGANHAMSYYVDKAGYENAILKFWNDFDMLKD